MQSALVLTTINIPKLLFDYVDNFEKYNHKKEEIDFIVIPDLKTPLAASEVIKKISKRGFRGIYFDIEKQKKWLQRFPKLNKIIPYNSDCRRNIGYLLAKERGAEIIISIDDDNYPQKDKDYLSGHKIVGVKKKLKAVSSSNNWYNICRHLKIKPKNNIYPRGFPYSKRWKDNAKFTLSQGRIVINGGLWLEAPDVDAITLLNGPIRAITAEEKPYIIEPGTFSPINTQNTAIHVDILPCYWYIRMGDVIVDGLRFDRYGDIWSSFFTEKIINHTGDRASFGPPVSLHLRNPHDPLKELKTEQLKAIILTEKLVLVMESIEFTKNTYGDCYWELSDKLKQDITKNNNFSKEEKDYLLQITDEMKIWVEACSSI